MIAPKKQGDSFDTTNDKTTKTNAKKGKPGGRGTGCRYFEVSIFDRAEETEGLLSRWLLKPPTGDPPRSNVGNMGFVEREWIAIYLEGMFDYGLHIYEYERAGLVEIKCMVFSTVH